MTDFRAMYERIMANEPREMPADFAPDMWWADGDTRHAYLRVEGVNIQLGYKKTTDAALDRKLDSELKKSVWLYAELIRLGRLADVREVMGLSGSVHSMVYVGPSETMTEAAQTLLDAGFLLDGNGLICGRSEKHPRGPLKFSGSASVMPTPARQPRAPKALRGRKKITRTCKS